ncbi:MAG: rhodanese-like domain-containing protein [Anaerolineae bacterium]|nr:rhodanese-like domain-containing protein [Anaerolineae bacterium]
METLITPEELRRRLDQGEDITVVDVRPAESYRNGHIRSAIHIPRDRLPSRLEEIPRDRPVVTY